MKHFFSFLIILTFLGSCKSPKETLSPKETVEAYLAATNRFDSDAAKELLILNNQNLMVLETLKKMEKSIPDNRKAEFLNKEKNAVYTEKEITQSTAVIIVSSQEIAMPFEFSLKKTNNIWLIQSITEL
ncbi:hypothetical protein [Flavobacterium ginsengiterrae]|uniref:DUF4878 domain-containing protein n=1 Tax=Flavobacterium ginsengiterrae TaxID=871695 RepID=A0ABP7GKZ2_9FLAO